MKTLKILLALFLLLAGIGSADTEQTSNQQQSWYTRLFGGNLNKATLKKKGFKIDTTPGQSLCKLEYRMGRQHEPALGITGGNMTVTLLVPGTNKPAMVRKKFTMVGVVFHGRLIAPANRSEKDGFDAIIYDMDGIVIDRYTTTSPSSAVMFPKGAHKVVFIPHTKNKKCIAGITSISYNIRDLVPALSAPYVTE